MLHVKTAGVILRLPARDVIGARARRFARSAFDFAARETAVTQTFTLASVFMLRIRKLKEHRRRILE